MSVPEKILVDDEWRGEWRFPPGWSADDQRAYVAIQGNLIHEQGELARVRAEADAVASSPAALLAAARAEVDDAKRARETEERRVAGESAWATARAAHGDRVERLDTDEGDVFVLLAMSDKDLDAVNKRARMLLQAAAPGPSATAPEVRAAEDRGMTDARGAQRDAILVKLLHPSRERAQTFLARKAAFWADLIEARDRLVSGRRVAEGKGSAP